jgi:hypothetical protein
MWSGYRELFGIVREFKLKLQVASLDLFELYIFLCVFAISSNVLYL